MIMSINVYILVNWKETREFYINFENKKIKRIILFSPYCASNIGVSKFAEALSGNK